MRTAEALTKDLAKAVEWYRKSAEQGWARAQYDLGRCYHKEQGVARDLKKAMEWYLKAAEQGWADAQYIVGEFYSHGYGGIKVNNAEASKVVL